MLLSLDHVTVRSADFDRTEHFYCKVLGLRPGLRPALSQPGRWYYVGDEAVLHVLPRKADAGQDNTGPIDHFALKADDLPAFEQRLCAAGLPFERQLLAGTAVWQIFVRDPDGARVEICFEGDEAS
jgi:catechol 2,3-dioxygenase-like lactoylglutathione lyase family enzyme